MTTATQTANNCMVLIPVNSTNKIFMKIEYSKRWERNIIKFLTHKTKKEETFTEKDEKALLKETVTLYFENQISPDRFEKTNTNKVLKEENVFFHVYKTTINKNINITGNQVYLVDPRKLRNQKTVFICKKECFITDSVRKILLEI